MKSLRFKRSLAFLMSVILTVASLTSDWTLVKANAQEQSDPYRAQTTTDEGIVLTKTATFKKDGSIDLTFTIDGSNAKTVKYEAGTTDIVLVLDCSNSMTENSSKVEGKTRMQRAKEAANAFIDGIAASNNVTNENVRIGVVRFGKYAETVVGLTNKSGWNNVKAKINAIQGIASTNVQDGIHKARVMLADSKAANKIVIVLTDGEANASDVKTSNGTKTFVDNSGDILPYAEFDYNNWNQNSRTYTVAASATYKEAGWYDGTTRVDASKVTVSSTDETQGTYKVTSNTYHWATQHELYKNGDKYYKNRSYSYRSGYSYSDEFTFGSQYIEEDDYWDSYYYYYTDDTTNQIINLSEQDVKYYNRNSKYYYYVAEIRQVTYSPQVGTPEIKYSGHQYSAIIEARYAKDAGVNFYSIVYDTEKDTAKYEMENVASVSGQCYYADSNSVTASLDSVFDAIKTQVDAYIAAATGTQLVDTLPSYMSFNSKTGDTGLTDVTISGNTMTWDLSNAENYTLDANGTYSRTVNCSLDVAAMIHAYATKAGKTDEVFKAEMAEKDIEFALNESLVLSYKNVSGNDVSNNDISVDGKVGVPVEVFTTHKYEVNYFVDDKEATDNNEVSMYAYEGERLPSFNHISDYSEEKYDYKIIVNQKEGESVPETMSDSNVVVDVYYTTKSYDVKFWVKNDKCGDNDWVQYGTTQKVKYGDKPDVPSEKPGSYEKDNFSYSFKEWGSKSTEAVTDVTNIYASYNEGVQLTYPVYFMAKTTDTKEYALLDSYTGENAVKSGQTTVATTENVSSISSNDPSVKEVRFNGKWYTDKNCTEEIDFANTPVTEELVLYAGYENVVKTYNVEYVDLNGKVITDYTKTELEYGQEIPSEEYVGDNYEDAINNLVYFFKDWDNAGKKATDELATNGKIVVTAQRGRQEALTYTVTWYDDNDEQLDSQKYKYNETAKYSKATPTKSVTGYDVSFVNFKDTASDATYSVEAEFKKTNITLKAQYDSVAKKYDVVFKYRDTETDEWITDDSNKQVPFGTAIDVPAAAGNVDSITEAGVETKRTFTSWNKELTDGKYVVTADREQIVTATYDDGATLYKVTFMNGESVVGNPIYVPADEYISSYPDDPEKEPDNVNNYEFSGWYVGQYKAGDVKINQPTVVEASYTAIPKEYKLKVNVVYPGENGTTVTEYSDAKHFGETATYVFNEDACSTVVAGKTVKYDVEKVEVSYGEDVMPANNTFSVEITDNTLYPEVTIYLAYEPTYKINYHVGLTVDNDDVYKRNFAPESAVVNYYSEAAYAGEEFVTNGDLTVYDIENDKFLYEFMYWADAEGKEVTTTGITCAGADVNVYAMYKETHKTVNVTFVDPENGITENNDNAIVVPVPYGTSIGDKIPAAPGTPERTVDKNYLGGDSWNISAETVITKPATVEAIHPWETRKYTVTFLPESGNTAVKTGDYDYNSDVTAPDAPAKNGFSFDGWYTVGEDSVLKVADHGTLKVEGNITVKAHYTANTYVANFYVLKPDKVATMKANTEASSNSNVVGQTTDYFTEKLGTKNFEYQTKIGMELTETFGADILKYFADDTYTTESAVEELFSDAIVIAPYTYTTALGNKITLKDYDWYVIKNVNKTFDVSNKTTWHVDGVAKTIELEAPEVKTTINSEITYNGSDRNADADMVKDITAKVAALNDDKGTYVFDHVEFGDTVINEVKTYEGLFAVATYTAADVDASCEVRIPLTVTVKPLAVEVLIVGSTTRKTYDGTEQTVTLRYSPWCKEQLYKTDEYIEFTGNTQVTGKTVGEYPLGLKESDFANKNKNFNVTFKLVKDGSLGIDPIVIMENTNLDFSKIYGDADPDFNTTESKMKVLEAMGVLEADREAALADLTIYRVDPDTNRNVGTYDLYVDGIAVLEMQEIRPYAMNDEDEDSTSENDEEEKILVIKNPSVLDNYMILPEATKVGTFTINKRTAYVTMHDASKYVGDADPAFSASVSNMAYNDSLFVDPWRIAGENEGTYAIHANVGENGNYNVDFTAGTLTIMARQAELPTPPVAPPTRPTITPVTPTPTPTPVTEEEPTTPPTEEAVVEIPEEATETPQAAEPEAAAEVVIEEEAVPEAASICWIHWLVLGLTLVYAIYASARAVQNKRELDEEKEVQEN